MDMLRTAYTTTIKPWRDSDITVSIRWFRADPLAQPFPAEHRFGSLDWENDHNNSGLGEQRPPRGGYDRGANFDSYMGVNFCGSLEAFKNGGTIGVDPALVLDSAGRSVGCARPLPISISGMALAGAAAINAGPAIRPLPGSAVAGAAVWSLLRSTGGVGVNSAGRILPWLPLSGQGWNGAGVFSMGPAYHPDPSVSIGPGLSGLTTFAAGPLYGPNPRIPVGPGFNGLAGLFAGPFWRPVTVTNIGPGFGALAGFVVGPLYRPPAAPLIGPGLNGVAVWARGPRQPVAGGEGLNGVAVWATGPTQKGTGGLGLDGSAVFGQVNNLRGTGGLGLDGSAGFGTGPRIQGGGGIGGNGVTLKAVGGPPAYKSDSTVASSTGPFTINLPSGTVQGDGLLLCMGWAPATGTPPPLLAGWEDIGTQAANGVNVEAHVWAKIAGASEPASYTVACGSTLQSAAVLIRVSPCILPVEAQAGSSAAGSPYTTASITTLGPHRLLVTTTVHTASMAVQSPFTQIAAVGGTTSLNVAYTAVAGSGPTGSLTVATGISSPKWGMVTCALA